jgi:hypothetical protein
VNVAWAFAVTYGLFRLVGRVMELRVSPEAELEGLDVPEFGASCYPDFVMRGHAVHGASTESPVELEEGSVPTERIPVVSEAIVEETTRRVLALVSSGADGKR